MPIEPDAAQRAEIEAVAGTDADGPVVMLNLNRYRDREEYARYAMVAARVLEKVGGRIQWYAQAQSTVVGTAEETWDDVIAVWYPSRSAFLALATDTEIEAAFEHRRAGLARAAIVCCPA
jgi:uncharacterized protein (DUF1330 family)